MGGCRSLDSSTGQPSATMRHMTGGQDLVGQFWIHLNSKINQIQPSRANTKDINSQKSPEEGLRVKWCKITPNCVHNWAINHKMEVISLSIDLIRLM